LFKKKNCFGAKKSLSYHELFFHLVKRSWRCSKGGGGGGGFGGGGGSRRLKPDKPEEWGNLPPLGRKKKWKHERPPTSISTLKK